MEDFSYYLEEVTGDRLVVRLDGGRELISQRIAQRTWEAGRGLGQAGSWGPLQDRQVSGLGWSLGSLGKLVGEENCFSGVENCCSWVENFCS